MGKKFYGQFTPPVDEFIFKRYFPDENIQGVLVECGAFDGETECSGKYFEESMGWKAYNIEPIPWIYNRLCRNRPQSKNLNYALSSKIGKEVFRAIDHPQFGIYCTNGSLSHTIEHEQWLRDVSCKFIDIEVELSTWNNFIESEDLDKVDLLILDVEGHEKEVIKGMEGARVLPDIICIEVGHISLLEMRHIMGRLGYTYDTTSHVNAFFILEEKLPLFQMRASMQAAARQGFEQELGRELERIRAEKGELGRELERIRAEKGQLERTTVMFKQLIKDLEHKGERLAASEAILRHAYRRLMELVQH